MTGIPATRLEEGGLGLNYSNARIMVVDDNQLNITLISALLRKSGLRNIETAANSEEALHRIETAPPDLLLLDIMMPGLSGFDVCALLRKDPRFATLPIIMQTALNRPEDRAHAFSVGATDYIVKPLNPAELLARVRIHLENQALIRDLSLYRRRTSRELEMARSMQIRMLPSAAERQVLAERCGLSVFARFEPSSELGGDFWGMQPLDDGRALVYLMDFSGHGLNAALNTFRVHAMLRNWDFQDKTPAAALSELNDALCPLLPSGQFATMLLGYFDPQTGSFSYASAAGTAPIALGPSLAPTCGPNAGLPLGIVPNVTYDDHQLHLPPGSCLLLYSDAAIETEVDGTLWGEEGLLAFTVEECERQMALGSHDPEEFLSRLSRRLHGPRAQPLTDDLTALMLTRSNDMAHCPSRDDQPGC
jgi:sigma-B regulation protein RsbU (phosphoserine phosphatase)